MQITHEQLSEHRKARIAVGEPPEMWVTFADVLLDAGYTVFMNHSHTTTRYLKVCRLDSSKMPVLIRCSDHAESPKSQKSHFYLGKSSYGTTTLMDGLLFVRNYFYGSTK